MQILQLKSSRIFNMRVGVVAGACTIRFGDIDRKYDVVGELGMPTRLERGIGKGDVKATHRDSTSAAQHKTQGKRKADRWKIDCGSRRREHKTLVRFPSPKSLNYYWLLLCYINNVHTYGPIRNKSLLVWHVHIIHLLVF